MTIPLFLLLCALVSMIIAIKPPSGWTLNFMCMSFSFLIGLYMYLHR